MKEKINQTAGRLKQTVRAVGVGIATLTASFFMSAPAYAAGVQDAGGDGLLVRLGQAQIVIGDHVAVRARFSVDVTHVRRLDLGVIKLE